MNINPTTLRLSFNSGKASFIRSQKSLPNNEWLEMLRKFAEWPELQAEAIRGFTHAAYKEIDMEEHDKIQRQIVNLTIPRNNIIQVGDLIVVKKGCKKIGIEEECAGHFAECVKFERAYRKGSKTPKFKMLDENYRESTFCDPEWEFIEYFGRPYGNISVAYYDNQSGLFTRIFNHGIDVDSLRNSAEEPKFKVGDDIVLTEDTGYLNRGTCGYIEEINPFGKDTFAVTIPFFIHTDSYLYVKKSQIKRPE